MNDEMQQSDAKRTERDSAAYREVDRPQDFDSEVSAEPLAESAAVYRDTTYDDIVYSEDVHIKDDTDALSQRRIIEDAESDLSATSDDRLIALLCYWTQLVMPLVMPIIVLLSESGKRRSFQRHHAIQSLGLTGGIFFLTMASFVAALLTMPITGPLVMFLVICLSPIAYFMAVSAYVFYGWQAHKGMRFSIPYLSNFLRKQGWMS